MSDGRHYRPGDGTHIGGCLELMNSLNASAALHAPRRTVTVWFGPLRGGPAATVELYDAEGRPLVEVPDLAEIVAAADYPGVTTEAFARMLAAYLQAEG